MPRILRRPTQTPIDTRCPRCARTLQRLATSPRLDVPLGCEPDESDLGSLAMAHDVEGCAVGCALARARVLGRVSPFAVPVHLAQLAERFQLQPVPVSAKGALTEAWVLVCREMRTAHRARVAGTRWCCCDPRTW